MFWKKEEKPNTSRLGNVVNYSNVLRLATIETQESNDLVRILAVNPQTVSFCFRKILVRLEKPTHKEFNKRYLTDFRLTYRRTAEPLGYFIISQWD